MIMNVRSQIMLLHIVAIATVSIGTYHTPITAKNSCLKKKMVSLSLRTTDTWRELPAPKMNFHGQQEKCAIRKVVSFKARRPFKLRHIAFHWCGKPLQAVDATLYSKEEHKPLALIEENLISDGKWSKDHRHLVFDLDEKLIATKKFFLVLNFPATQTLDLKAGSFYTCHSIKKHVLPLT